MSYHMLRLSLRDYFSSALTGATRAARVAVLPLLIYGHQLAFTINSILPLLPSGPKLASIAGNNPIAKRSDVKISNVMKMPILLKLLRRMG